MAKPIFFCLDNIKEVVLVFIELPLMAFFFLEHNSFYLSDVHCKYKIHNWERAKYDICYCRYPRKTVSVDVGAAARIFWIMTVLLAQKKYENTSDKFNAVFSIQFVGNQRKAG